MENKTSEMRRQGNEKVRLSEAQLICLIFLQLQFEACLKEEDT